MLKQDVINKIDTLPEDVSITDIMYILYVLDKHNKALGDIDANRVYDTEDVRKSIIRNYEN